MPLKITTEEFRKHVPATASFEVDALNADMLQVESDYLHKAFDADFYEELCEKYETATATDLQLKLVNIIIAAVSNLAQASFLPVQPLQFTERGVHIISSENEKTPFEHQVKAAQQAFLYKGFQAIDRALLLLEKNIDHPDFALWAASEASTIYKQHILSNADEFSEHYNIGNSRRTYLALLPSIRKAETFYLEREIGEELLYELKDQLQDRDVLPENKKILDMYMRPALAHLVVSQAIEEGGFNYRGEALSFTTPGELMDSTLLNSKRAKAWNDAQAYLTRLRTFLNREASEEKYAAYFHSNRYTAPGSTTNRNTPESKIYGFF